MDPSMSRNAESYELAPLAAKGLPITDTLYRVKDGPHKGRRVRLRVKFGPSFTSSEQANVRLGDMAAPQAYTASLTLTTIDEKTGKPQRSPDGGVVVEGPHAVTFDSIAMAEPDFNVESALTEVASRMAPALLLQMEGRLSLAEAMARRGAAGTPPVIDTATVPVDKAVDD
jgi:hypothetical protein